MMMMMIIMVMMVMMMMMMRMGTGMRTMIMKIMAHVVGIGRGSKVSGWEKTTGIERDPSSSPFRRIYLHFIAF